MKEDIKRIISEFGGMGIIYLFAAPFIILIVRGIGVHENILFLLYPVLAIVIMLLPTMKDLKVSPFETNEKIEDGMSTVDTAALILVFLSLCFFLTSGANIISEIKIIGPIMKSMQTSAADIMKNLSLPLVIVMSLTHSIVTELIFRGVLLNALRKYGDVFAIIISSILYALIMGNNFFIHLNLIVGILVGTLYVLSNDIKAPIIFSLLMNLSDKIYEYMTNLLDNGMYFYGIILIIGLVYLASRKDFRDHISLLKNQYRQEKNINKGKYTVVFKTEAFIALFLITILSISITIVSYIMN